MVDERIISYFHLCAIKTRDIKHLVNCISNDKLNILFTKKQIDLFLREVDQFDGKAVYHIRELVVGGDEDELPPPVKGSIIVI